MIKRWPWLTTIMVILVLSLAAPPGAPAEVVGRFTQVEGRVDLLKGGKLPALPVKVGDSLESGDVLRSKSLSKAQITFMDNSVVTLSPESRLAIEDFRFEPAQQKRNAVLNLFQGLAHVLVNKLYKVDEPDFIIKTHTAIAGVRGTDFGVRLAPNSSTVLNFDGKTRVASNFPEITAMLKRAQKIAFGPTNPGGNFPAGSFVDLGAMQGTEVGRGLPPTRPFAITAEDRQQFHRQMTGALLGRQGSGTGGGTAGGTTAGSGFSSPAAGESRSTSSVPGVAPIGLVTGTGNTALTLVNVVTVPPEVTPTTNQGSSPSPTPTPTPTPSTFNFTQQYYSAWIQNADAPYSQANLVTYSWGQRTGVYDGYFSASTEGTRTANSGTTFDTFRTGTSTGTATGTVTGFLGQTLTGTMNYTGNTSVGSQVNRTGNVTILPTGELTYNWTDVVSVGGVARATGVGTTTQTPGTYFTQTASGNFEATANPAGNQQNVTNAGELTGTRVMAGVTTSFKAGFAVTNTSPDGNTFGNDPNPISISSQGVLGAPDATGVRTGVMTSTSTTAAGNSVSGGPVRYVPATATTPDATFGQLIGNPTGEQHTTVGMWAQTSDSNASVVTQTYEGSHTISPSGGTTGTLSSTGWGNRVEPSGNTVPSTGTLTVTVTDTTGQTQTSPGVINNQTVAAVLVPNGSRTCYTGPAQGMGVSNNNGVFSTTGTVTINSADTLTHNFNGSYFGPANKGTLTGGTQTLTPGEAFTQTASGTLQSSSTTPFQVQTSTNPAAFTGSRSGNTPVVPGNFVISPNNLTITNTATAPNSFLPSTVNTDVIVKSQGVIIPNGGGTGGAGAVTVTLQSASNPGGAVGTAMGPVNITSAGNLAANNLVGKNIVTSPTNQKIPATQTAVMVQNPVSAR